MKLRLKRYVFLIMAFLLLQTGLSSIALAADVVASGTCGQGVSWTLDSSGLLTISGTGSIDNYSYSNQPWYPYRSSVTAVSVSDGVTAIGDRAFYGFSALTKVTIPSSVTSIGGYAFYNCTSLTNVTIPTSVTIIGNYAFHGCGSVKATISGFTTNITSSSFYGCRLTAIIPDGELSVRDKAFSGCKGLTEVMFPSSIKYIGEYAFSHCENLTDVTIPNSVRSIGNGAFTGCSSMTNVTIPLSVKGIGAYAFADCSALTSMLIPEGVTSIELGTFQDCSILTSVMIPTSVTSIDLYAFDACYCLTDVYYPGAEVAWSALLTNIGSHNEYLISAEVHYNAIPITITNQPESQTVTAGEAVTFTVVAQGATSYQWQWRKGSSGTWTDSSAATTGYNTNTLKVSAAATRNGYQYRCKVSNSAGEVISSTVTLTVVSLPTITTQPEDKTVTLGETATFTVAAENATSYQWYFRFSASDDWQESTAASGKTATYSVTTAERHNGYQYRCKVSNSAGEVYSSTVTLKVKPKITTQPKSVSVAEGGTATFTVAASGATSYQWQWRNGSSGTWADSTSATTGYNTKTLKVSATAVRNGYQYRCKVSNSAGTTYTNIVTLTVLSKPTITTQPKSVSAAEGGTATFTVAASGATSYLWQWRNGSSGTWADCTSATTGYNTKTLKVSAASHRNGYQYRCAVSNSNGTTYTNIVTLTVRSKPAITTQPKSVSVAEGGTAAFTVAATGATSYQWQWRNGSSGTWADCTSATTGYNTATLKVSAASHRNGYQYRCLVSNASGEVFTNIVTLTVK